MITVNVATVLNFAGAGPGDKAAGPSALGGDGPRSWRRGAGGRVGALKIPRGVYWAGVGWKGAKEPRVSKLASIQGAKELPGSV